MPPITTDEHRARPQDRVWSAEFLLYTCPFPGEVERLLSAEIEVPEHRVREAVAQGLEWMRRNRFACPPEAFLRVRVEGNVYFDAAIRLLW